MTGSYHQKQDLLAFGQQVQRMLVTRIIVARNAGTLTTDQMKILEELLPTSADVQLLLDTFEPKIDVASAIAELEPMVHVLQKTQIKLETSDYQQAIALRSLRNRLLTALRYLKVDPR